MLTGQASTRTARQAPEPPVIFLMGPTAAGKTALAMALCRRLPCDIVSVDSAMIYRGLDIGTDKPSPEMRREAPHRLIDICDPCQSYSAGRFLCDSLAEIRSIRRCGRIPLLVGGTGLYFRALGGGLSRLPRADPSLRARLVREAETQGWPALHRRLCRIDPEAGGRIHPNDPQRIQRALEVWELTGRPLSVLWRADRPSAPPFEIVRLAVSPAERSRLHERIERRLRTMLQRGLIEETAALRERGVLATGMPALRLVGYRQVWTYLEMEPDRAALVQKIAAATRQLAKRQQNWLRSEPCGPWIDSGRGSLEQVLDEASIQLQKAPALRPYWT